MSKILDESVLRKLFRYPDAAVCLPLAERVPLPEIVSEIVNMRFVLRLRGVRQLALAHFVYPDATHSRFGHSLGVFYRCGLFVQSIMARRENQAFRDAIGPGELAAVMAAALLHDTGHFPFAHSFEELIPSGASAVVLKHDVVLERMLRGELPDLLSRRERHALSSALHAWNGITIWDVIAVLTGREPIMPVAEGSAEDQYRVESRVSISMRPEVLKVLHALLDGPFDADKLDYVQRDSLHAGNSAGRSVDEARLVDSVVIRSLERGIGIHESGLQAVQSLYTARERMFETVYWHRTNRAANRMFTEALSVLAEFDADVVTSAFGRDLFRLDDEAAIRHVGAALAIHDPQAADTLIGPLSAVAGRRGEIYMRNVTVATEPGSKPYRRGQGMPSETHAQICAMYDSFLDSVSTRQPAPWLAFEHEVRTKLRQLAGNVAAYEVVLDVPDARFETPVHDDRHTDLGKSSFWVWVDGTPHPVRDKDPLFAAVLDNWRMNARKIRVMLSPRAAANLAGQESSIMELLKDRARTYAADLA